MPPKYKKKDCLIMLVNTGCTDEIENEDEPTFLENAKLVMRLLIQRRIFLHPEDEIGIILMGSSKTKNRLSYDNFVEMNSLQRPNWNLVESVSKLQGTTENSATWFDGINLALEYIDTECVDKAASKTLVLLTDFKEDPDVVEQYNIKTIASDIQARNINLLAIGNKSLNGDSQIELNPSEEAFANVCETVQGKALKFDDTIPKLRIYKDKSKTGIAWKADMDLFDIEIPIIMYTKAKDDWKLPKFKRSTDTRTVKPPVKQKRALVDRTREQIEKEDVITGYLYGRKFIPFSDDDKAALKYKSGPRGFTIYGFAKQEHISIDCLGGDCSYIVIPAQQWASPFYSLVKSMADRKKVAIVRRVYRENSAPVMGVLFPKIDVPGEPWCLVYIELIFAEDRQEVPAKSLESTMKDLSEEQQETVDDLINSMMLMEVEDNFTKEKKEAFEAGTVPDVTRQLVWDRLTHRALNPGEPLAPVPDFLKKFLEPPHSVQRKSKPLIKSIRRLFPMKVVRKKKSVEKNSVVDEIGALRENLDIVEIAEGADATSGETEVQNNTQNIETEDEELSRIADSIEAESQGMDIDLDELAKDM